MNDTMQVKVTISKELAENLLKRDRGAELALISEIRNAVGIIIRKEDTK